MLSTWNHHKRGEVVKRPEAGSSVIPLMGLCEWIREPFERSPSWPIAQSAQHKSENAWVQWYGLLWDFQGFFDYARKALQWLWQISVTWRPPFSLWSLCSGRYHILCLYLGQYLLVCSCSWFLKCSLIYILFSPNILLWRFSKLKWCCSEHLYPQHLESSPISILLINAYDLGMHFKVNVADCTSQISSYILHTLSLAFRTLYKCA